MTTVASSTTKKLVYMNKEFVSRMHRAAGWLVKDSRKVPTGVLNEGAVIRLLLEEGLQAVERRLEEQRP